MDELDKTLLDVLEQHGVVAMLCVIHDEIERAYDYGYSVGCDDGYCECLDYYDTLDDSDYDLD